MLLRKFNSVAVFAIAISPLVINSPSVAFASETPAPAAPEAVKTENWVRKNAIPMGPSDISNYIQGFHVEVDETSAGGVVKLHGLVHKSCRDHLRIELDNPKTDDTGVWALRVEKWSYVNENAEDPSKTLRIADKDCTKAATVTCTRYNPDCVHVDMIEGVKTANGIVGVEEQTLDKDGRIAVRFDDPKSSPGTPGSILTPDLPEEFGGPIEFKTKATQMAEARAQAEKEHQELLVSTCKDAAEKGDRDHFDALVEMLGKKGVKQHKELLAKLEKSIEDKEVSALKDEITKAKTLSALNSLIEKVEDFARNHKNPEMKMRAAHELLLLIGKRVNEIGGLSDEEFIAKLDISTRALEAATGLDTEDDELAKNLFTLKHKKFADIEKLAQMDGFDYKLTSKDFSRTYNRVVNWAKNNPSSAEAQTLSQQYQMLNAPVAQIPVIEQREAWGIPYQTYTWKPVTAFEAAYMRGQHARKQRTMAEQFNAHKQMYQNGFNGAVGGGIPMGGSSF